MVGTATPKVVRYGRGKTFLPGDADEFAPTAGLPDVLDLFDVSVIDEMQPEKRSHPREQIDVLTLDVDEELIIRIKYGLFDTVVREYFQHRVPISAVSRAETPNTRLYSVVGPSPTAWET